MKISNYINMKHTVRTSWLGDMRFDSEISEHHLIMDAPASDTMTSAGPSPKKLLLSALAGCTGIDVISILKKMKHEVDNLKIDIEAKLTEEHPRYYNSIHIIFEFTSKEPDADKYEKAISLSQEKYCGVSFMFKHFAKITHEIKIIKNS
jgi:putative redox protein